MASVSSYSDERTEEIIEAAKAELVETDGEPLESPWHRAAINLLIDVVVWLYRGRKDYFVGGNMFVYFGKQQARQRYYRGPDFFFVKDTDRTRARLYWWVFEEDGKFPDVIIELLSPTTAKEDRTTKKAIYEKTFRTPEYFCYDPATRQLEGWRLAEAGYQPIAPDDRGRLWCEELGVWVGTWDGPFQGCDTTWLRFFAPDGQLLQTEPEAERRRAEAEKQQAHAERQQAEAERQRAKTAEQLADAEHQRAITAEKQAAAERQRVKKLKAELARLRAKLADKGKKPPAKD
jgi:Uma2 family endonuclease